MKSFKSPKVLLRLILLILLLPACTRPASQGPLAPQGALPSAAVSAGEIATSIPETEISAGTTAEALPATPTPAPDRDPAYPQLAGLLVRSESAVSLFDSNGYAQPLLNIEPLSGLALSTSGLAFSQDGDILVYDLASGALENLTQTPERVETAPAWLPGAGAKLLCMSAPAGAGGASTQYDLTLVAAGEYELLGPPASVQAFSPAPEGRRVALDGGRILELASGELTTLSAADFGLLDPPGIRLGAPAWSPDGRWLAWNAGYTQDGAFMQSTLLFDLQPGAAFALPFYLTVQHDGLSPPPLWSPDGRWLALDVHAQDASLAGVWVYPTGGAPGAEFPLGGGLSSTPGQSWAWSPDGTRLAVSPDDPTTGSLLLFETGDWTPVELPIQAEVLGWSQ